MIRHVQDREARRRLCVDQYRRLIARNPEIPRGVLAARVATAQGVSVRSLQLWVRKFGTTAEVRST